MANKHTKFENEFFRVSVGKNEVEVEVLNGDRTVAVKHTYTTIEFDNLCHLIINNKDSILNKICFERRLSNGQQANLRKV